MIVPLSTNNAIKIVQHNLNGQYYAVEQLRDYCIHKSIDIALIQDFPSKGGRIAGLAHAPIRIIMRAYPDSHKAAAAIVVFNADIEVIALDNHCSSYFAVAAIKHKKTKSLVLVSSYFKSNARTNHFMKGSTLTRKIST